MLTAEQSQLKNEGGHVPRFMEYLNMMEFDQLLTVWRKIAEADMIPPLPAEYIDGGDGEFVDNPVKLRDDLAAVLEPLGHIDVVLCLSDAEDSAILEILMKQPFSDTAPRGRFVKETEKGKKKSRATGPDATGKTSEPKAPKEKTVAPPDDRIICFVNPNPKKASSKAHAVYELYKVGMTVAEFIKAGGGMDHVKWDSSGSREFIKLCTKEEWAAQNAGVEGDGGSEDIEGNT
jgi:hypothetical protein